MKRTEVQAALNLLAKLEARSAAEDEEINAVGWVVALFDQGTGSVHMYGPWPKDGAVDASAWAADKVDQFNAIDTSGEPLRSVVFPLLSPTA